MIANAGLVKLLASAFGPLAAVLAALSPWGFNLGFSPLAAQLVAAQPLAAQPMAAQELLALTESFLLLHEIENLIRMIIDTANPSQEEIDACIEERDRNKGIAVDRMTFSNYCSLLRKGPEVFGKKLMRIKITKELSTQMAISLETIRETRNMIMHFHPDENDDGAKSRLSKARDFIRKLANEIEEYD